jgi:hypothetical protein
LWQRQEIQTNLSKTRQWRTVRLGRNSSRKKTYVSLGWSIWIFFSTFLGGSFKNKFIILHWLHILNFKLFGLDLAVRWVFKLSPEIFTHFQQLVTTSWHHFRNNKSIANFISFNLSYNTFNSMQYIRLFLNF